MARKPYSPVAVEPVIEVPAPTSVTNNRPGTTLFLGDGRKLAFGETAEVGEVLAADLIGRGLAA